MRVLVSVVPGTGHWLPFVPLVRALKSAGHTVTVASSERMRVAAEREASFEPIGPDVHESELEPKQAMQMVRHDWPVAAVDDLQKLAREHSIVVRGPWDPAGYVSALRESKPRAMLGYAVRRMSVPRIGAMCNPHAFLRGPHFEAMDKLGVRGLASNPSSFVGEGDPVIDITPPFLHPAPPEMYGAHVTSFRHETATGFPRADKKATTVLTFGSVVEPIPWVAEELESAGVDYVETSKETPVDLPPLLDDASLLVSHGGWGSMVAALYAGVPAIAVPVHADNAINGLRLHQSGAGLCAFNKLSFRNALKNVHNCKPRVEQVAKELRRLPSIENAVGWLERIAGSWQERKAA